MERIEQFAREFAGFFFEPDLRFSLVYLNATMLLAFFIWLVRRKDKPFLAWLFPRNVFLHPSNLIDFKLFLANRAMSVAGVFGPVLFSPLVAHAIVNALNGGSGAISTAVETTWGKAAIATVVIVVSTDFCKYWSHRLHHQTRFLWPFHAVHHSAEVLTPLTLARAHPMETVVRNLIISVLVGVMQGGLLFVLVGEVQLLTIGGANALYFTFNMLGANLRHSHIWLSYGRAMEHVFISPAQHQIHHSIAVEHHDKNYGSIFALWDWMFGTLYVPDRPETLTFGVSDAAGVPLKQPHPTLRAALITPFNESWQVFKRRQKPNQHPVVSQRAEP